MSAIAVNSPARRGAACPPRRPHLSYDERSLVLAAKESRGQARAELVDVFLPRIGSVARRYRDVRAVSREDLMQAGVVGLLNALERYDPSRENHFWAYASWWVVQAMQELVSSLSNVVVLSDRALRQLSRLKAARLSHMQAHRREPSNRDLAAITGLPTAQVSRLVVATRPARALDQGADADDPGARPLTETLRDPAAEDALENATLRLAARVLPAVLATLTPRELAVVRGRYGIGGDQRSLRELATELSLSGERVRQIEQIAIGKLRDSCDATTGNAKSRQS